MRVKDIHMQCSAKGSNAGSLGDVKASFQLVGNLIKMKSWITLDDAPQSSHAGLAQNSVGSALAARVFNRTSVFE